MAKILILSALSLAILYSEATLPAIAAGLHSNNTNLASAKKRCPDLSSRSACMAQPKCVWHPKGSRCSGK